MLAPRALHDFKWGLQELRGHLRDGREAPLDVLPGALARVQHEFHGNAMVPSRARRGQTSASSTCWGYAQRKSLLAAPGCPRRYLPGDRRLRTRGWALFVASISRSLPSPGSLTFQARVGTRGPCTHAPNACGLKQDSKVRSCLLSRAVFSAWHVEHTGWKCCSAPYRLP